MKASANAHDWHCEDHDTYGWRGEACRLCPEAPDEQREARESVEKQLAAVTAERQQARQTAEFWKAEHLSGNQLNDELRAKVAALEAENKRLCPVVSTKTKKTPTGFVATCQCGIVVGAMDYRRMDSKLAGQILGKWLHDGCTVEPRFSDTWTARVERCRCEQGEVEQ